MPATRQRIRTFLAAGGQTRGGEMDMDGLLDDARSHGSTARTEVV
jgi:hypothetical protein